MTPYLVAYDLLKEKSSFDYEPLWAELKRLGGHRTQYSLWLVGVSNTAKKLHDHLRQYLDGDDRLFVAEFPKNRCATNSFQGTADWVGDHPALV